MTGAAQSFTPCGEMLHPMMDFVVKRAEALNLPQSTSLRLQLIAEELFTNTFRHGPPRGGHAPVTLSIDAAGEDVELVYEDGEPEWNPLRHIDRSHLELPLEQRPVGSLGWVLIESFARKLQYERCNERNRIRVLLQREP